MEKTYCSLKAMPDMAAEIYDDGSIPLITGIDEDHVQETAAHTTHVETLSSTELHGALRSCAYPTQRTVITMMPCRPWPPSGGTRRGPV